MTSPSKIRAAALIQIEQKRHLPDAEFAKEARRILKEADKAVSEYRAAARGEHEANRKRKLGISPLLPLPPA